MSLKVQVPSGLRIEVGLTCRDRLGQLHGLNETFENVAPLLNYVTCLSINVNQELQTCLHHLYLFSMEFTMEVFSMNLFFGMELLNRKLLSGVTGMRQLKIKHMRLPFFFLLQYPFFSLSTNKLML
ncbi:hypothetical protein Hanom_Chr03g00239861 [Helianthus anomalus]